MEALLEEQAWHAQQPGVGSGHRARQVVVNLTTVGERLDTLHLCIESLLRQTVQPDQLILWLPVTLAEAFDAVARRSPLARQVDRGLSVRLIRDVGPHTKLVYAWRALPDAVLVTADDDTLYPEGWLGELVAAFEQAPLLIHCHRAHMIRLAPGGAVAPYETWSLCAPGRVGPSQLLFPTGHAGVLYPPGSLDPAVTDEALFRRLCPTADDIWFKAMAWLAGTPARKVAPFCDGFPLIRGTEKRMLWTLNRDANDSQLAAVLAHFGLTEMLAAAS